VEKQSTLTTPKSQAMFFSGMVLMLNPVGTSVGGNLDCEKSGFEHSQKIALNAARIEVKGNALLGKTLPSTEQST
jgi:hypothetical protein